MLISFADNIYHKPTQIEQRGKELIVIPYEENEVRCPNV